MAVILGEVYVDQDATKWCVFGFSVFEFSEDHKIDMALLVDPRGLFKIEEINQMGSPLYRLMPESKAAEIRKAIDVHIRRLKGEVVQFQNRYSHDKE